MTRSNFPKTTSAQTLWDNKIEKPDNILNSQGTIQAQESGKDILESDEAWKGNIFAVSVSPSRNSDTSHHINIRLKNI